MVVEEPEKKAGATRWWADVGEKEPRTATQKKQRAGLSCFTYE